MAGLKFTFTGDNQDVLKKINQIQTELKKVYNRKNTKIDLSAGVDFSLLGENFKRLDQQSREAFDNMSKDAQKYVKEIQENILSLQQVEKMQAGLNSLYEDGDIDLNAYIQSQARLTVLHEELAKGINESRAALEAETTTTKIATDSIAGLHAKVLMLTTDYMNLSKAQREGTEGAALLKNLQETQTQLDNASLSMDKYASGAKTKFDSLGMSVTQIARELPSLAMGPQMFFLAISNNLGPFQDAIAAARKEYQDAIAAGKTATPVWKQLLSSLKGSGPILAVVTTLFVAFGDDIIEWVGKLISGKKEMKNFLSVSQEMALGIRKGMKDAVSAVNELDVLYKATQDQTRTLKERNAAIDEIQKMYPSYFNNLTNEAILAGKAKDVYMQLRGELIANSIARAQLNRMDDVANKREDSVLKRRNQYNTYLKAQQEAEKASLALETARQKARERGIEEGSAQEKLFLSKRTSDLEKAQENAQKQLEAWHELVDEVRNYDNILQGMSGNIDVSALINKPGETYKGTGTKDINAYSDQLHRIAELRSKSSRERIRLEVELANQEEQARINAMQDGFEKEERQRKLNNKIELESIERQKQDYINKVIDVQRQIFEAEENAKVSKDKNYKKQTFNPSSVSVDTSVFDTIESETLKKQANETTEYYNDILSKYQDYITKRLNVEKQFNADREKLQKSGASDAQLNELEYQRNETLNSIDKEFAMREDSFQSWANSIADFSLKELQRLLVEAERELERMEFVTPNSSGLATQRAKVNTLKQQISDANNKNTTSPDKRSVKDWQDLYKTLSKVEKEFNEIGDAVGGTAGEIMSAAGSISSSTLQMIDGIVTLANSSSTAMSETAKAASTAIQTVEKASVILMIISTAIQIATKIANMFSSNKEEERKRYIDQLNAMVDIYERIIEKQKESIKFGYGFSAITSAKKAMEELNNKTEQYRKIAQSAGSSKDSLSRDYMGRLDEMLNDVKPVSFEVKLSSLTSIDTSDFSKLTAKQLLYIRDNYKDIWSALNEEQRNALQAIIDAEEESKEIVDAWKESITGISYDNLYSEFIDTLSDMDSSAEDMANNFGEYLRKSILASMVANEFQDKIDNLYEMWVNAGDEKSEGGAYITEDEAKKIQERQKELAEAMTKRREEIEKTYGFDSSTSSQESTKKGFAAMSQDSADELNGRFTALQIAGEESKNQLVLLNQVTNALLNVNEVGNNTLNDMLYQQLTTNSYLEDIAKYTKALLEMKNDLAAVKNNTAGLTRR